MATKTTFTLPERELGRANIEIKIKKNHKAFGKLRISKGGIEWVERDDHYGTEFSWRELADLIAKSKTGL